MRYFAGKVFDEFVVSYVDPETLVFYFQQPALQAEIEAFAADINTCAESQANQVANVSLGQCSANVTRAGKVVSTRLLLEVTLKPSRRRVCWKIPFGVFFLSHAMDA